MRCSASNASLSCSFKYYFYLQMLIFISIICLIFSTATANGYFNPLIQLPTDGIYSNLSTRSTAQMVLNIFDFGAQGDGFTDDTKVINVFLLNTDIFKIIPRFRHFMCIFPLLLKFRGGEDLIIGMVIAN